jgi:hypothetical protein
MNMKRMRGRNHRPNGGGGGGGGFRNQQNGIPLNRNHVFDSSGPEMRVRGTAQQLFEKYTQLARDATSNGDRVLGEANYQHAEHYFRIISAINQAQGTPQGEPRPYQPQQNGERPQGGGNYGGQQNDYPRRDYNQNAEANGEEQRSFEPQQPRQDRQERNNNNGNGEPRRFEPRQFDQPRKPQQDFQPRPQHRPDHNNIYRTAPAPVPAEIQPDPRIDISQALEAELAAANIPAGLGEQPSLAPAIEARAIPIIPDAPPAPAPELFPVPETAAEAPVRRPRGRPRIVKAEEA